MRWPDPPFGIALVDPQIPGNTGAIARLCAATGAPLHLVGRPGFKLTNARLRRAGLDYWEHVDVRRHASLEDFFHTVSRSRCYFLSTRGQLPYFEARYTPGDVLVLGSETTGLPASLLEDRAERTLVVPMRTGRVRSLNLAMTAGLVLYEAIRQVASE